MILIVDAPDLSGKTYAIERIAKKYNSGFILKNAYKPKTKEDSFKIYEQYMKIFNMTKEFNGMVILDRFYPSQAVYSILRGRDEMESKNIAIIEKYCKDSNFKYIYLNTPISVLEERYNKRGDEHIKKDQLLMLKERYDNFYKICTLDKVKINTLETNWLDKLDDFIGGNDEY